MQNNMFYIPKQGVLSFKTVCLGKQMRLNGDVLITLFVIGNALKRLSPRLTELYPLS